MIHRHKKHTKWKIQANKQKHELIIRMLTPYRCTKYI